MANLIPDGEYYILNAASNIAGSPRCIDISGSQLLKANAKVQLYDMLRNNAQAFQVRNSGGRLIITSRLYGNRFGPVSSSSTAEVKLNVRATGVETNIKWEVGATSTTSTHGGVTYNCFTLKTGAYYLYAAGTANGSVIRMSSSTGTNSQWYFIPIGQIDDGGLYEIRSSLKTDMAVDVEAAGQYNGTNVRIWTANGTNAQKFHISKKSGDIYTIRDISSGRYLDVDSARAQNGTNVQIWDANSTRAQDWRVLEYGKQTIGSADGKIVSFGSMVSGNGNTYMMDVLAAGTTIGTNLQIFEANNSQAQRFVLLPTTAEDSHMPVPHSLGIADGRGGTQKSYGYTTDDAYLKWGCSAAWCSDNGANHYEIRYRTRTMNPLTSAWRSWSSWSSWTIPAIEATGQRVLAYAEDILDEYQWSAAKNQQIEIELRSVGAEELSLLHSKSLTQSINIYRKPVVDITRAGWTPGGILVEYTTDYPYGMTYLTIDSIKCDGTEVLREPVELSGQGTTLSGVIDRDKCLSFIADGAQLEITYRTGYDQQRACDGTYHDTITATYDAGTVSVEPTLKAQGAHLFAYVPHLGEERLWVLHNNATVECSVIDTRTENGKTYTVFEVLYPTNGDDFETHTEARSADGTQWGTDVSTARFRHISYAWTTDDGTIYLRKFIDERPTYSYTSSANYQADNLDSRRLSSVSFGKTNTNDLTAYGILLKDDEDPETVEDFEELTGKHAVFRDIYGGIHNVAVTGVSISRHSQYDEINISMIEETI
ncbi:RICIN domain-containing protein [Adlercreutzia sp. ZJ138]|uniref:RICIN domain-containing protein n=1 Tax=Adlercreutzia sp. ZJ138 TaxID=2709405 RepID=UPI0013E9AC1F|nr:RICIN domain-containing protein [Adlercreutzia sp. ZJ138]